MKGKRVVALALTGCLMFGQTAWAEGTGGEKEQSEITQEEQTVDNSEQEDAGSKQTVIQSDADQNKEIAENAIETKEVIIYLGQEKIIYNRNQYYSGNWRWTIRIDDEDICKAEMIEEKADEESKFYHVKFNPVKTGETYITINDGFGDVQRYHVTVKERPEDAIVFQDSNLEAELLESWREIDENGDGLISKSELSKIRYLSINNRNITDLSGLEYAENLEEINLSGNKELKSIEPILNLNKIKQYNLKNTGISANDKWKLVKFSTEFDLALGEQANWITNGEFFDDDELIIEKQKGEDAGRIVGGTIVGVAAGEETIKISGGSNSQIIHVKVKGIQPDQEVGKKSDSTIKDSDKYTVLNSNGELWQVYPETKKVGKNVKRYVGGWIYSGDDSEEYAYQLQNDNTLWSDKTKLAENVKDFSSHYVLDNTGRLIDIYNKDAVIVENVATWSERTNVDWTNGEKRTEYCYVLKTDGTLWERTEVGKNEKVKEFQKIAENVKEINNSGYLDQNGYYKSFDGKNDLENVEVMPEGSFGYGQYYVGKDGHTYFQRWAQWTGEMKTLDLGEMKILDFMVVWSADTAYILTESNEMYKITDNGYEKIADHVQKMVNGYVQAYQGEDGLWRSFEKNTTGTKENPVAIESIYNNYNEYQLEDYGVVNDYNVTKNGILLLTHVKEMFSLDDYAETGRKIYAIRTDGTLWEITDVQKQVLDLNSGAVVLGDVNADGEVDIQDLRSILRYICEKEEFNEDQKSVADVDANGEVDIKDLRKVIRYVSGKESAL